MVLGILGTGALYFLLAVGGGGALGEQIGRRTGQNP